MINEVVPIIINQSSAIMDDIGEQRKLVDCLLYQVLEIWSRMVEPVIGKGVQLRKEGHLKELKDLVSDVVEDDSVVV